MAVDPTRRDFLRTTAAVGLAAAVSEGHASARPTSLAATADSVIFLMMTGGPSQLDTFDPKPDAPSGIRSPFAPIRTRVPGLMLSELFPKMAGIADKFSLIRSVYHDAPPVHEAGFQLLNTGRLFRDGPDWPSVGAVAKQLCGWGDLSTWLLPYVTVDTGISTSHGQQNGWLPTKFHPVITLGEMPLLDGVSFAMKLLRNDAKFLTINQFTTVFDKPSWDCHADGGSLACDLGDYKATVAPEFDAAFTRLILDLEERGLLERTLVVATGEFGRTPKFNSNGGRDHWAGCWTTILAGGGVQGGRVIGKSDAIASEPTDRPVHARDIPATIFRALGVGPDATIPGPDGQPVKVYEGQPVRELFA
jgi:hypothetical protein